MRARLAGRGGDGKRSFLTRNYRAENRAGSSDRSISFMKPIAIDQSFASSVELIIVPEIKGRWPLSGLPANYRNQDYLPTLINQPP